MGGVPKREVAWCFRLTGHNLAASPRYTADGGPADASLSWGDSLMQRVKWKQHTWSGMPVESSDTLWSRVDTGRSPSISCNTRGRRKKQKETQMPGARASEASYRQGANAVLAGRSPKSPRVSACRRLTPFCSVVSLGHAGAVGVCCMLSRALVVVGGTTFGEEVLKSA